MHISLCNEANHKTLRMVEILGKIEERISQQVKAGKHDTNKSPNILIYSGTSV